MYASARAILELDWNLRDLAPLGWRLEGVAIGGQLLQTRREVCYLRVELVDMAGDVFEEVSGRWVVPGSCIESR